MKEKNLKLLQRLFKISQKEKTNNIFPFYYETQEGFQLRIVGIDNEIYWKSIVTHSGMYEMIDTEKVYDIFITIKHIESNNSLTEQLIIH